MRKLMTILLITLYLPAAAQQTAEEIRKHLRVMDSLVRKARYSEMVQYARGVAPVFEKNNSFPFFYYYKLQIEYTAWGLNEAGQHTEAEKVLLAVMPLIEKNTGGLGRSYRNAAMLLSTVYLQTGQFTKSYQASLLAWESSPLWWKWEPSNYAMLCSGLITMCSNLGKYEEAEYYAAKFEGTIKPGRYTNTYLTLYYSALSGLYTQMGSLQKAALYAKKIEGLLKNSFLDIETKMQLKTAQIGLQMATGNKDTAGKMLLDMLTELELAKKINTAAYQLAINNYSLLLLHKNMPDAADSVLSNYLANTGLKKTGMTWTLYYALSLVKHLKKNYTAALLYADSALAIQPAPAWGTQQFELPVIKIQKSVLLFKLGRAKEAMAVYDTVTDTYTAYIKKNISYLSEPDKNNLVFFYYHSANIGPNFISGEMTDGSVKNINKYWKQALFFKGAAGGEQGKLYRMIRRSNDVNLKNLFDKCKEQRKFLQNEYKKPVSSRSKKIDSIALIHEKEEQKLSQYLPAEAANDTADIIIKLQQQLKKGEALIDFTRFTKISSSSAKNSLHYGAFTLRYDNPAPQYKDLCPETVLQELTGENNAAPGVNVNTQYPAAAMRKGRNMPGYKLYKTIWQPLLPYLEGIKTVYIVPDGLLHKIAFHALPVGKTGYLSDNFTIRYLYHASSILDSSFNAPAKPGAVQVWAGINYNSPASQQQQKDSSKSLENAEEPWDFLPGTLRDGRFIKQLCAKRVIPCRLYTGAAATEIACKQNMQDTSDLLVFLTHGKYDIAGTKNFSDLSGYVNMPFSLANDPMQQISLVTAGRNKLKYTAANGPGSDDGLLRASEIVQLNLEAKKLVVLTACRAAQGMVQSAEGVYGMNRAFKMAGAKKILASLWSVDDGAVSDFMEVFYGQLLGGKPAAAALKTAQDKMKKKYPPYQWAGFVLIE
jgi:CHAT domain-containing protein